MAMWVKDDDTAKRWHEEFEEDDKRRLAEMLYIMLKHQNLKRYEAIDILNRAERMVLQDIANKLY